MNFCPNCGSKIKINSDFCPNCGTQIKKTNKNEKICSNCGSITINNESFCKECGTKFEINEKELKKSNTVDGIKKDNLNWIGILIAAIIGLITIFSIPENPSSFVIIYIASLLIGGFIAGFIGEGNRNNPLKYGVIIGFIFPLLIVLHEIILGSDGGMFGTGLYAIYLNGIFSFIGLSGLLVLSIFFIGIFILSSIMSIIGALIGSLLNLKLKFDFDDLIKRWKKGEM